ncbi:MAG: GIY-YIG nuclease family protein [Candidatus Taylorbacteria bacterium]
MYYVYMLKSVNSEWYYVGSTGDVGKRLKHHNYGDVISTRPRRPYKVVYIEKFSTIECARSREKQIKQSRSIKDGIIKKLALSSNG